MKKRTVALLLALVLAVGVAAGGTIAWLTSTPAAVINTFTEGKVEITLLETDNTDAEKKTTRNTYQMIPGTEYKKDPIVTVVDGSEDCYLFVKIEEGDAEQYLTYTLNTEGWAKGDGKDIPDNVYYRTVLKDADTKSWNLLVDNKITVKDTVTKENMTAAAASQLKFTAYAIQKANIDTAADAWAKLNSTT